jgi:hypothetical protein
VRRAEPRGRLELRLQEVDRDDRARTREHGALDRVESDPACADHRDCAALLDAGRVDDGADAGDHPAGEQARRLEPHVPADRHHLRGVHRHALRERGRPDSLVDPFAARRAERRVEGERVRRQRLAERRLAAEAEAAAAARADERDDDVVADGD